MKLRYAGECRSCARELPARAEAIYERRSKTVRCVDCTPEPLAEATRAEVSADPIVVVEQAEAVDEVQQVEAGSAGLSARREFERRHANREQRVRTKHPKLGGLILALSDDPQTTTAWDTGALGEELLGNGHNKRSSPSLRVLHDRRIPGTRANIDHIAVTPTGIWIVDAKRYVGKRPTLRVEGGLFRPRTETLMVGGRTQNKLVDGMLKQLEVVRGVVGQEVPLTGVLCFIESDWPLIGGDFSTRGVMVTWPKRLYSRLEAEGPQVVEDIELYHRGLAEALPPA